MDVSIIVPVYQDRDGLERLLGCLDRQTASATRFEVLVVDNAPTPDLALAELVAGRPNVRLLHEPTPGSYAARNRGIAQARADVLAFTDADCLPEPAWVEAGLRFLRDHPDVAMAGGHVEMTFLDPRHPRAVEVYQVEFGFDQRRCVEKAHYALTANLWTTRRVLAKVGSFNPHLKSAGDLDWGLRVHHLGLRQAYASDVRVGHPARSRARDQGRKLRRMIGARRDASRLRRQGGAQAPAAGEQGYLRWLAISALLPGPAMLRLIRNGHIRSPLLVVRYLGLWAYFFTIHLVEPLRLALGGTAVRL